MSEIMPWLALAGVGAYHGLNPAMGWLFAVALGLQEKQLGAVFKALPPIVLGHLAAVLVTVLLLGAAQLWVNPEVLRYGCAVGLILFGLYKLIRSKHPRWVGMRVGFWDLTLWSFLMASAHGSGLMLLPALLALTTSRSAASAHQGHQMMASTGTIQDLLAVGVHTLAMFVAMALIAIFVYQKFGLGLLRRSWFNLDRLWALALVGAGGITLLL